jgi:hypothetical protein
MVKMNTDSDQILAALDNAVTSRPKSIGSGPQKSLARLAQALDLFEAPGTAARLLSAANGGLSASLEILSEAILNAARSGGSTEQCAIQTYENARTQMRVLALGGVDLDPRNTVVKNAMRGQVGNSGGGGHLKQYETLMEENPLAAARYYAEHTDEIITECAQRHQRMAQQFQAE